MQALIQNTTFTRCSTMDLDGRGSVTAPFYLIAPATCDLYHTDFIECSSEGGGGAVCVSEGGSIVNMYHGRITACSAISAGGVVAESGGVLNMRSVVIENCYAHSAAGACHAYGKESTITADACVLTGNEAGDNGGAVRIGMDATLVAKYCMFRNHLSGTRGGTLAAEDGAQCTLESSTVANSWATQGGLFSLASGASLLIVNCVMKGGSCKPSQTYLNPITVSGCRAGMASVSDADSSLVVRDSDVSEMASSVRLLCPRMPSANTAVREQISTYTPFAIV